MTDKIELKDVKINIKKGDLTFPKEIGNWRQECVLNDADIELELDIDQLDTEYLKGILEGRGLFVADEEPTLEKYSDSQIEREAEYRGFYVSEDEPEEVYISDFSTKEILSELKRRGVNDTVFDVGWFLQVGKFEDFLIELERLSPYEFRGLSKLKLVSNE